MALERWSPFWTVDRWEPFRDLVDTFGGRPAAAAQMTRSWLPAVDMHETKDSLVLKVELPGMTEKDVTVSLTGDLLSIKGERRWADDAKEQKALHVERVYGQFERLIQLPMDVQADKVKANYRDGVLEVTLPKVEEIKPREIKVDVM